MKLHLVLFTALLLLRPVPTHGQTAAPADPFAPSVTPAAGSRVSGWKIANSPDGTLRLTEGPLPDVVEQIEMLVPNMIGPDGNKGEMPNVLYGPGAQSVKMPAELRLRQVSPVQALTLVAAAAGCALEPIGDPDRGTEQIIGYRFMLAPEGLALVSRPDGLSLVSGNPQLHKTKGSADPSKAGEYGGAGFGGYGSGSSGFGGITIVGPATGSTDSKPGGRTQSSNPNHSSGASKAEPSQGVRGGTFIVNAKTTQADDAVVRVYALGAFMRGEPKEMDEKQKAVQNLVAEALERSSLGADLPLLSFHNATKALIVKGTAAQHEIVEQIIQAMKENALSESGTQSASGGFGGGSK